MGCIWVTLNGFIIFIKNTIIINGNVIENYSNIQKSLLIVILDICSEKERVVYKGAKIWSKGDCTMKHKKNI